jgi:drug/metabolite transporter (DMT)-like permease
MASKLLQRGAVGLGIAGVVIGTVGSRSLHSKLLFIIGLYLVVAATLLFAGYFAIGNPPKQRLIGGITAAWAALFAIWLLVPLHRTPWLHYGTGIIWVCVLGVLTYIWWRLHRQETSDRRRTKANL